MNKINDIGIIQVVLQRLENQRLPRMKDIKKNLDQGIMLNESDIAFLSEALHDANRIIPYVERHPEYKALFASVIHFYKLITDEALTVEKPSRHD